MEKQTPKFIKRSRQLRVWNMSRTTAWRREKDDPSFPRPIVLGAGLVVYELEACLAWEAAQIAAARGRRQA